MEESLGLSNYIIYICFTFILLDAPSRTTRDTGRRYSFARARHRAGWHSTQAGFQQVPVSALSHPADRRTRLVLVPMMSKTRMLQSVVATGLKFGCEDVQSKII